jgi:hypothetical protein
LKENNIELSESTFRFHLKVLLEKKRECTWKFVYNLSRARIFKFR